jgi:DNA-binding PucR family transcriptional regulator
VLGADSRAGRRLVESALGPLLEPSEERRRLLETLDAFFRGGSHLKVAASLLHVHPNTLAYRIRQIRRLTGLDLERSEDRLRAEVAVHLAAFQRLKDAARGAKA